MSSVARAPASSSRLRVFLEHEVLGREVRGRIALGRGAARPRRCGRGLAGRGLGAPSSWRLPARPPRRLVGLDVEVATSSWNSSREICSPGSSGAIRLPRRVRRRLPLGLDVLGRARGGRRVGGHGAEFAHDARAAAAVGGLALLPVRQHGRGDEDRGVGAGGDPDHQREREVLQRFAAEQQQRGDRQQRAEARRQRPGQHLGHRAVDDLRERGARHARHVLAHTIEHDDRVVQRISEDRQQRGDGRASSLPAPSANTRPP